MKTDLPPTPARPPAKRRTLHDRNATPNVWLHQWAGDELLPPSARVKATDELERRKTEDRLNKVEAGILIGTEGATPQQVATFSEWWVEAKVTRFHAPGPFSGRDLRAVIGDVGTARYLCPTRREELRAVVLAADTLVALPPRVTPVGDVWDAVRYAKHRKVAVTVILPDGKVA